MFKRLFFKKASFKRKMKYLFSILICLITFAIQAQTFEDFINNGDHLYDEEKYLESAKEYQKAFNIQDGSASQYYNAACSWALSGDTVQAIKLLSLSAEKGWKNLKHIKRDKDLTGLKSLNEWNLILEKVEANLIEYEKDFDQPLKMQLERIYLKDQTLRQLYRDAEEKFGQESEEMNYFWELIYFDKQHSANDLTNAP